jgi:hypothetical protein
MTTQQHVGGEEIKPETNSAKWEYSCDTYYPYQNDMDGWLNGWGEQGWEIISAHFTPSDQSYQQEFYRFIFKRQIINNE